MSRFKGKAGYALRELKGGIHRWVADDQPAPQARQASYVGVDGFADHLRQINPKDLPTRAEASERGLQLLDSRGELERIVRSLDEANTVQHLGSRAWKGAREDFLKMDSEEPAREFLGRVGLNPELAAHIREINRAPDEAIEEMGQFFAARAAAVRPEVMQTIGLVAHATELHTPAHMHELGKLRFDTVPGYWNGHKSVDSTHYFAAYDPWNHEVSASPWVYGDQWPDELAEFRSGVNGSRPGTKAQVHELTHHLSRVMSGNHALMGVGSDLLMTDLLEGVARNMYGDVAMPEHMTPPLMVYPFFRNSQGMGQPYSRLHYALEGIKAGGGYRRLHTGGNEVATVLTDYVRELPEAVRVLDAQAGTRIEDNVDRFWGARMLSPEHDPARAAIYEAALAADREQWAKMTKGSVMRRTDNPDESAALRSFQKFTATGQGSVAPPERRPAEHYPLLDASVTPVVGRSYAAPTKAGLAQRYKGKTGYALTGTPGERRWKRVAADWTPMKPMKPMEPMKPMGTPRSKGSPDLDGHFRKATWDIVDRHMSLEDALHYRMRRMITHQLPAHYPAQTVEQELHDLLGSRAFSLPNDVRDHALIASKTGDVHPELHDYLRHRAELSAQAMSRAHQQVFPLTERAATSRGIAAGEMLGQFRGYTLDNDLSANGSYYADTRKVGISLPMLLGGHFLPQVMNSRVDPVEMTVSHELAHYLSHQINAHDNTATLDDSWVSGNAGLIHPQFQTLMTNMQAELSGTRGLPDHPIHDTAAGARLGYVWHSAGAAMARRAPSALLAKKLSAPGPFDVYAFEAPTVLTDLAMHHPEALDALDRVYGADLNSAARSLWGGELGVSKDQGLTERMETELRHASESAKSGGMRQRQASLQIGVREGQRLAERRHTPVLAERSKARPEARKPEQAQAAYEAPRLIVPTHFSERRSETEGETIASVVETPVGRFYVKHSELHAPNEVAASALADHLGVPVPHTSFWRGADGLYSAARMVDGQHVMDDDELDLLGNSFTMGHLPKNRAALAHLKSKGVTDLPQYLRDAGRITALDLLTGNEDSAIRVNGNMGNTLIVNGRLHGLDYARGSNSPIMRDAYDPEYPWSPQAYVEAWQDYNLRDVQANQFATPYLQALRETVKKGVTMDHRKLARQLSEDSGFKYDDSSPFR